MRQWILAMLGLLTGWWILKRLLPVNSGGSPGDHPPEWPVLVKTREHPQTTLIRDWLENRGVAVIVEDEHMKGYFGTPATEHRVRVSPEQYGLARRMLSKSPFARYLPEETEPPPGPGSFSSPGRPAG